MEESCSPLPAEIQASSQIGYLPDYPTDLTNQIRRLWFADFSSPGPMISEVRPAAGGGILTEDARDSLVERTFKTSGASPERSRWFSESF